MAEVILRDVADFCPVATCASDVDYAAEGTVANYNGDVRVNQVFRVEVNGGVDDYREQHHYADCWYDRRGELWCH